MPLRFQVTGVFSAAECSAVLAAAEQLGLSPAEQDRAGGSPGLVTVDPWLADLLWQRISPFMPSIVNSKQVLGLEELKFDCLFCRFWLLLSGM